MLFPSQKLVLLTTVLCCLLPGSRAAAESTVIGDQFKCQSLRTHNQTRILCHARSDIGDTQKARQHDDKSGRVCHKLFQLSQRYNPYLCHFGFSIKSRRIFIYIRSVSRALFDGYPVPRFLFDRILVASLRLPKVFEHSLRIRVLCSYCKQYDDKARRGKKISYELMFYETLPCTAVIFL